MAHRKLHKLYFMNLKIGVSGTLPMDYAVVWFLRDFVYLWYIFW